MFSTPWKRIPPSHFTGEFRSPPFLPGKTRGAQPKILAVPIELLGQQERRTAEQSGKAEAPADRILANVQTTRTLLTRIGEKSRLLFGGPERRQLHPQQP